MQNEVKVSYTVTCSSKFRDMVLDLALRKKVNAGDIARSIILAVPDEVIENFKDPGEPENNDREKVVLKSGPAKDRPWARKPRLQVRLPSGYENSFIRKALSLALAIDKGEFTFSVENKDEIAKRYAEQQKFKEIKEKNSLISVTKLKSIEEELEKLKTIVSVLCFEPLKEGVTCKEEALYVLGFPPFAKPTKKMVINRFRMLATIHHPDSELGSHQRMSQLNAAMDIFKRSASFS